MKCEPVCLFVVQIVHSASGCGRGEQVKAIKGPKCWTIVRMEKVIGETER